LTEDEIDSAYAEKLGMKVLRLPLENMEGATPEALDKAVDLIKDDPRGKVLVHCLAGFGRTGMVLCAYLMREKGMSAEEAIRELKRLRPGSLKRRVQQQALLDYEGYLAKVRARQAPP
jgi:atypical dual specificity phosphatase